MKSRLCLAVALLAASASGVPAQRLPRTAIPEHYDLHLSPDFDTDTFAGRVDIRVRLTAPAQSITLNAAEIDFHDVSITAAGTSQVASVTLDPRTDTATFTVPQILPAGTAAMASAATWAHLKDNWERVERSFGIFQGIPRVVEGASAPVQHRVQRRRRTVLRRASHRRHDARVAAVA